MFLYILNIFGNMAYIKIDTLKTLYILWNFPNIFTYERVFLQLKGHSLAHLNFKTFKTLNSNKLNIFPHFHCYVFFLKHIVEYH